MIATKPIVATIYGFVCDEPQPLGTVALKGERLHYHPSDNIPTAVLKGVKRGLQEGHPNAKFRYNGCLYRYQAHGVVKTESKQEPETRQPRKNALTGKNVYLVTVATNSGNRVLDFEADCLQDAREAADHLKMKVVDVQPA